MRSPSRLTHASQIVSDRSRWLQTLAASQSSIAELLARSEEEQRRLGYFHTLREICQQPATWLGTCNSMQDLSAELLCVTRGLAAITLTGSGSSEYAADCVRLALRKELEINVQAIPSGALLTHGCHMLPVNDSQMMVSFARSGDSPESVGALTLMRKLQPDMRHLIVTCNRQGSLATKFKNDPDVTIITLEDITNDRSLVMTSSFTNMVLAARFLGLLHNFPRYLAICQALARNASAILSEHFDTLAQIARQPFQRAVYLGSGAHAAAAREASLKMLEMTAGRVNILCETYLGLRHGPMSAVHADTLVVCFLSSDPMVRAYEIDVIKELEQKRLGAFRLVLGEGVPGNVESVCDSVISYENESESRAFRLADEDLPVLDVLVGQVLALFRCLAEGLRPDSPSESGVINRVVQGFKLHLPETRP